MRKILVLVFSAVLSAVSLWGQAAVSFPKTQMPLSDALAIVERESGRSIVYNENLLSLDRIVATPSGKPLADLMPLLLAGTGMEARMQGNIILIVKKDSPKPVLRRGTVTDKVGPLAGAVLMVEGTTTAATTDIDGSFSLSAVKGDVIRVSLLGYKDALYQVGSETEGLLITMADDITLLDEVVVVGYGTQKKVNLTGAVGVLSSDQLDNKPIVQASTALQGSVPGVTVTTSGGAPGDDTGNIRIRGIGTFGGSSSAPLVLIDGIEGSLNSVDAAQIDKISILKDAASSSIYGSRAANGVILVTTKRAEKGVSRVSYRGYVGWQRPTTTPDTVGPVDYMKLNKEATENDGAVSIYTDEYISNYLKNNYLDPDSFPIVNWKEHVLNGSGLTHNHTLSLSASILSVNAFS